MITVKRLLEKKGDAIWSIPPHAMVYEALSLMAEKNIGAVLVIERGILVGILSERDYARKIILRGKRSIDTQVWEIMTPDVIFVNPDQSIEECMAIMTEKHVRHLPVFSGEELVGLISIGDVVKELISEKEFVIEQLENYIAGRQ
ncbi:MAG: CBS domain-containing protein [Anaerolineales bacterium]